MLQQVFKSRPWHYFLQWILAANLSRDHMLKAVHLSPCPHAIGTDVKDGHEIKLEEVEPSLNVLPATITKLLLGLLLPAKFVWNLLFHISFESFCALALSNYDFRTELTQNTNILVTCSLQPFKPKLYPHIKFSTLIFIHFLKELVKRIYFCPSGNHFINSHISFPWLCIDSVKRKLTFVSWDLRS